jgi:hypothetical protein
LDLIDGDMEAGLVRLMRETSTDRVVMLVDRDVMSCFSSSRVVDSPMV